MPSPRPAPAFGIAAARGGSGTRVVARTGAGVVDVAAAAARGLLTAGTQQASWWSAGDLREFLSAGRVAWQQVTGELEAMSPEPDDPALLGADDTRLLLPVEIGDYVDFYASEHHATNLGRILRPGQEPLLPNWRHLPVGYHGRAGTVVVSGTPVRRPCGQRRQEAEGAPTFGPTQRLDVEVEVGFVVGVGSSPGEPVPVDDFAAHVFGVCLVNDWSARDIQAWEAQPLGPFLGKSFATSMSAWIVPLDALSAARIPAGSASADLLPYLRESTPWGLDLSLELLVNGEVVSRPPYRSMFWSPAQMLAHLTSNGASVRIGDLFASGTVSGAAAGEQGSLIEAWGNERFLADGDEVVIRGDAPGADGGPVSLGEVRGRVLPVSRAGGRPG